jgi:SAM-dependent methyltransferase
LGGLVLDPCAGYGGRAAGTLAAGRRYFGIDPHPSATSSFQALFQAFGDPSARFTNAPFEDVLLDDVLADCVLTSPPYFSVERYSNDPTQSWVRYKTWTTWVEEFLTPFARKSFQVLREGGVFCVNTKNVRVGRQEFPIVDELARIARVLGFTLERTLELPLGRIGKEAKFEPILVLRK